MRPARRRAGLGLAALLLLTWGAPAGAQAGAPPLRSAQQQVDGVSFHYLTAGDGPAVILLHGYTQTAQMWRGLIPRLARDHRVVAPDLPGFGDSSIPADGLDMKTAAVRVHALARSLGIERAIVVGHDIGLMVAYAYAALYPAEVERLALMDAFLPGVGDWEAYYRDPRRWHFTFNGPTAEALVAGRERIYLDHFWNDFAADRDHTLPRTERQAFTTAYARPGRMRAAWAYFRALPTTARDFATLAAHPLQMPVLVLAGAHAAGATLPAQVTLVAPRSTAIVIAGSGHWLLEERPAEVTDALTTFIATPRLDAPITGGPSISKGALSTTTTTRRNSP